MLQFTKPDSLNGEQLVNELAAAGVVVTGKPLLDDNLILWLDIPASDKSKASTIVNTHLGVDLAK
jgi:hypothetical protein